MLNSELLLIRLLELVANLYVLLVNVQLVHQRYLVTLGLTIGLIEIAGVQDTAH